MKIIVFDLGGVVVRICRTWPEACAAAGLPYRGVDVSPEGVARRKAIVHEYEVGAIDDDTYFARLAATMDGRYDRAEVRALHDAWITGEYAGVSDLIDHLHHAGLDTGVLSNTNAHHWRQMTSGGHGTAKFPTPEKPRHVHASHLLGLAKPDPAIYHAFARRAGYAPADIVFFDDLPANVQAAREAGWHSHVIDHTGDPAAQIRAWLRERGIELSSV
jgi:HAD superfamily hydrolase (TIGR01509 family)